MQPSSQDQPIDSLEAHVEAASCHILEHERQSIFDQITCMFIQCDHVLKGKVSMDACKRRQDGRTGRSRTRRTCTFKACSICLSYGFQMCCSG